MLEFSEEFRNSVKVDQFFIFSKQEFNSRLCHLLADVIGIPSDHSPASAHLRLL